MWWKVMKVHWQHDNTPLISTHWYKILCQHYLHCPYLDSRVRQEDTEEYNPSAIYLHLPLLLEQAIQWEYGVLLNFPPSVPTLSSITPLHLTLSLMEMESHLSRPNAFISNPTAYAHHSEVLALVFTCIASASDHSIPGKEEAEPWS